MIHAAVSYASKLRDNSARAAVEDSQSIETHGLTRGWIQRQADDIGGLHIFLFVVARLVGCLTLLALSLATLFASNELENTPFLPPIQRVLFEWSPISVPIAFVSVIHLSRSHLTSMMYGCSGLLLYPGNPVSVSGEVVDIVNTIQHPSFVDNLRNVRLQRFMAFGDIYPAAQRYPRRLAALDKDCNSICDSSGHTPLYSASVHTSGPQGASPAFVLHYHVLKLPRNLCP